MQQNRPSLLEEYFSEFNWRKNENANHNVSFSNFQNNISSKILANEFLQSLPKDCRDAHYSAKIHIHNLESGGIIPYCAGHNLKSLIISGMKTNTVSSKPAKHLGSIMDQVMNYLYISQMEFSGAQAFNDFDTLIAPFIKAEHIPYKEVKQSIQRLVYNLNYTMRSGNQTPFTNLSLNYCTPKFLEDENAIIADTKTGLKYSDCQDEIEMIDMAFSEIMMEKDMNGIPFTFPILTVNLTSRFPWHSEAAKYMALVAMDTGSYYWMNYIGSGLSEDNIRAMCCRLNISLKELSGAGGLWNAGEGTGSLGVVTINFPNLGFEYKGKDETLLLEELDRRMDIALQILLFRKSNINKYKDRLMPFSNMNGWSSKNYYITIGVIGLHEMCLNYLDSGIPENKDFVIKILNHMREWTTKKQVLHKQLINIEMIPGEGSSYRLAFYTALLMPATSELDVFDKLKIEEDILPLFTGGTIFRVYVGDDNVDSNVSLQFIKKIASSKIPYFDMTCTFSVCTKESKTFRGSLNKCPSCGEHVEVYSRVVGYYRPVSHWNIGKKEEFTERRYSHLTIPQSTNT
jgi:anaerobic ribonucleoside-triphosphate reductase